MDFLQPGKTNWRRVKILACILVCLILLYAGKVVTPVRYGDGVEYLSMTISISQHVTPELRETDIRDIENLVTESPGIGWRLAISPDNLNYFPARNGNDYNYHFWLYSAFCVVPYLMLRIVGANPLNLFLITNCLLLLFLLWWLIYRTQLDKKAKTWLIIASFLSPIIFYAPWSHPEVFIYVFLLIGLVEVINGYVPLGALFIAIAASQSPPLSIVALAAMAYQIWQIKTKKLRITPLMIALALATICLLFLPYAFYWFNFGKPSLLVDTYASLSYFSIGKLFNLFLDLNFGMIIYVPLLFIALAILLVRLDWKAIWGIVLLVAAGFVCATTVNWNCGMMFIHRYAVWLLPILIIATLGYFNRLRLRQFIWHVAIWLCIGLFIIIPGFLNYSESYLKFGPVAKVVLSVAPSLYNPPFEVFAERTLSQEISFYDKIPMAVCSSSRLRKELVINEEGQMGYINGSLLLAPSLNLRSFFSFRSGSDVVRLSDGLGSFGTGWYYLEVNAQGEKWRWTNEDAKFDFILSSEQTMAQIQMEVASFKIPRFCIITVNGEQYFEGTVTTLGRAIQFTSKVVSGINHIEILSPQGAESPDGPDTRKLSFKMMELIINAQ